MEDDDDDNDLASSSAPVISFMHFWLQQKQLTMYDKPTNIQWQTSVHIEDIDDEEDTYLCNMAPLNPSCLLELSDGSDDEGAWEVIKVDDSEDRKEEPEESAEAELGQS